MIGRLQRRLHRRRSQAAVRPWMVLLLTVTVLVAALQRVTFNLEAPGREPARISGTAVEETRAQVSGQPFRFHR